jgi:hypothetical protein
LNGHKVHILTNSRVIALLPLKTLALVESESGIKKVKFFGNYYEAKKNALCEDHASLSVDDAVTVRRFVYNSVWGVFTKGCCSLKSAQ